MAPNSRRDFIRQATLGAGALMTASLLSPTKVLATPFSWTARKAVNPEIDNLRVVCGVNPAMITGDPLGWDMEGQNKPVSPEQVARTLDAMACLLAQKQAAADGWKLIFRKPESKSWASVKAAIKVNCIAKNHPRVAVVNKICVELNRLGVPFENIIIFDGVHDASAFYSAYVGKGLSAGVIVSEKHKALGGTMKLSIPEPHPGNFSCSRALVDGSIDILVNIAVNKGHDEKLGKATLTLKNNAGTFDPKPIHIGGGLDYVLAFNKSDAFWGGTPVRQQLCIVDSLWGSVQGPWAVPDKRLDRMVMGVFSGAVDYLTVKKIREPLLNAEHKNVARYVTEFGYAEQELGDLVTVNL